MSERYAWGSQNTAEDGLLDRASASVNDAKEKIKNGLRSFMNAVCLFSIIALEVLHRFVTYGFNAEFAWDYLFSALITSLTSILAFYVFFPNGKRSGRLRSVYIEAQEDLKKARKTLRDNKWIAAFRAWCRAKSDKEADAIIETRLEVLENLYVTREEYMEYRLLSRRKLKKLVKKGKITKAAAKQIRLCNKAVKCKPYAPTYFLSDVKEGKDNVYLRGKDHYEVRALTIRPLFCVAVGIVTSLITWYPKQLGSVLDVMLSIAISVFQICLASLSGYSVGQTAAAKEELAIRAKTGFIEEFNEEMESNEKSTA
jgi:hypothetical protein